MLISRDLAWPNDQFFNDRPLGQCYRQPGALRDIDRLEHFFSCFCFGGLGPFVEQFSVDIAGKNRASANAVGAFFGVDRLSESKQTKLRNDIGGTSLRTGLFGGIRNDIDDGTGATLAHRRKKGLQAQVRE